MSERSARVLVVEDNDCDVHLMRLALQEYHRRPVELIPVENGRDALVLLNGEAEFDLVVIDLNLPGLDGYEFLKRRPTAEVPVVVFSSSWDEEDSRRVIALGASDFIRKPSNYVEYAEAVCGFVGKWSESKTRG